jgi:hypothetical protein
MMLTALTQATSNTRFLVYVALLYVLAFTAGAWVPASSPLFKDATFIKLALLPLAQAFLLIGARRRWPDHFFVITAASCSFLAGVIVETVRNGYA